MPEPPDGTDEAQTRYQPFPGFADWASLPVNTAVYDGYAGMLDRLRAQTEPERLERAVRTATRLAAIDTGAIEGLYDVDRGFTMTVAVQSATWEAALDAREPVVRRSFEDALRAYDFVLDIATGRTEISEKAIKEIHALICASQDTYRVFTSVGWQERPLPRAEYKTLPNNPTRTATGRTHAYARPSDTPAEMARLVTELRSESFQGAHPILQAAYAHYAFVAIHPFADGNGRVARTLASAYLYRRPGVPLVIFADQKDEYLDTLEAADRGDRQPLVRFMAARVADVIGVVEVTTARPDSPPASTSLAALRELYYTGEAGVSREDLDAIARRVLDLAADDLLEQLSTLNLPSAVRITAETWHSFVGGLDPLPTALRPVGGRYDLVPARSGPLVRLQSTQDISATIGLAAAVLAVGEGVPPVQLVTANGQSLGIQVREVHPVLASVFTVKLRAWVDSLVTDLLARFEQATRKAIQGESPE
jgi:Fic family protein